ncbi:unnamed protein product [Ectocarpus sp. CCAP 1310/34]|nr:unnamed protein product [Ectocarpus sp. CCAP 1310/34]
MRRRRGRPPGTNIATAGHCLPVAVNHTQVCRSNETAKAVESIV